MSHGRYMPNFGRSLQLLYHFTRAPKNLPWLGRRNRKWKKRYYNHEKVIQPQTIFRWENNFRLSVYLEQTLDVTPNLIWSVMRCVTPYSNISNKVSFCNCLKNWLLYPRHDRSFKYLLKNFTVNDKG